MFISIRRRLRGKESRRIRSESLRQISLRRKRRMRKKVVSLKRNSKEETTIISRKAKRKIRRRRNLSLQKTSPN